MPRRPTYRDLILAALTRKQNKERDSNGHRQASAGHRGGGTGSRAAAAVGAVGGAGTGGPGGDASTAPGGISPGLILTAGAVITPAQARALLRLPEPEPLPTVRRAQTIVAWKRADLAFDETGHLRMVGPVYRVPYDPAGDTAAHHQHRLWSAAVPSAPCDEPPGEFCRCGFYGIESPQPSPQWDGYMRTHACLTVQVELWGRVVEHEHGWRAQHQRVLGAWVDRVCSVPACGRPVRAVAILPHNSGLSVCERHADHLHSRFLFTPAEMSSALAVECAWGPAPAARTLP